jgi:hypothetical protein
MQNCLNLGDLSFSSTHARKRSDKIRATLGADVLTRIVAFALFLLGAKREDIAKFVDMPLGTLLSFLTRMNSDGVVALQDRRGTSPSEKPLDHHKKEPRCSVAVEKGRVVVSCTSAGAELVIPSANLLQCKTVLFTFLTNGLLRAEDVAEVVAISGRRARELADNMRQGDVLALIDKHRGQQKDYLFTPEVKSELIQQVAANTLSGRPTSGRAIAEDLQQRCEMVLSERSVRLHLNKLGLARIADSLPKLLEAQKKTTSKS